jgi:hypothetical protein
VTGETSDSKRAASVPSLEALLRADLAELERIYREHEPVEPPRAAFRGYYLRRVDSPGAHTVRNRILQLGFQLPPFGVDFASHRWFFFSRHLQVGHFRDERARSRWRDTDTVALHYDVSRLPGPIRRLLYDEVKPLSERLMLGLGGLNDERGRGDLFFFALSRLDT